MKLKDKFIFSAKKNSEIHAYMESSKSLWKIHIPEKKKLHGFQNIFAPESTYFSIPLSTNLLKYPH